MFLQWNNNGVWLQASPTMKNILWSKRRWRRRRRMGWVRWKKTGHCCETSGRWRSWKPNCTQTMTVSRLELHLSSLSGVVDTRYLKEERDMLACLDRSLIFFLLCDNWEKQQMMTSGPFLPFPSCLTSTSTQLSHTLNLCVKTRRIQPDKFRL